MVVEVSKASATKDELKQIDQSPNKVDLEKPGDVNRF